MGPRPLRPREEGPGNAWQGTGAFSSSFCMFTVQWIETKQEVQEQLNVCPLYPGNRNGLSNTLKQQARDCSLDPTPCMGTSGRLLLTKYRTWFDLVELVSLLELAQQGPDVHIVVATL